MSLKKHSNSQTLGEEISNAVSHGVGALLAIAGAVLIIIRAAFTSDALGITSAAIYGASLIILYTFSTLYHSLTNEKAKKVFRIFDHCSIFLLIFGSYMPISLVLLGGVKGWVLFGINLFCTVVGIVFNSINLTKWHKISVILYVLMGWSVITTIKDVFIALTLTGSILILVGGIMYTVGILFYKNPKFKFMHFVWHLFVLGGSIFQFFALFFYCYK